MIAAPRHLSADSASDLSPRQRALAGEFVKEGHSMEDAVQMARDAGDPPQIMSVAQGCGAESEEARTTRLWFEQQIENAQQDQISGFASKSETGTLRGERAHARHCALYEAKQMFLRAVRAPQPVSVAQTERMETAIRAVLHQNDKHGSSIPVPIIEMLRESLALSSTDRRPHPCPQEAHDHCVWPRCDCAQQEKSR